MHAAVIDVYVNFCTVIRAEAERHGDMVALLLASQFVPMQLQVRILQLKIFRGS